MNQNETNTTDGAEPGDLLDTLKITKIEHRELANGTWDCGTMAGHRFEALAFPGHAENPEYELGDNRISKLWLQRIDDGAVVYNWDRGADAEAATTIARQIVDLLAAGLAEMVFSE